MAPKNQVVALYDVVKITAFCKPVHFAPDGISIRPPRVGDKAAIIEIYGDPPGYELECSGRDGITEWLCAFASDEVEFEKIE